VDAGFLETGSELSPVTSRARWIAWGLLAQVIGAGFPAAVVLERAKKDSVIGQITRYTVRLAWHEALRSPSDVALMAFGLVAFVGGSVLVARPFAKRRSTLFLMVPLAATASVLLLGVIALVLAVMVGVAGLLGEGDAANLDVFRWWGSGGTRRREDADDETR
jgi:hypothetical protein